MFQGCGAHVLICSTYMYVAMRLCRSDLLECALLYMGVQVTMYDVQCTMYFRRASIQHATKPQNEMKLGRQVVHVLNHLVKNF